VSDAPKQKQRGNWPTDSFGRSEVAAQFTWIWGWLMLAILVFVVFMIPRIQRDDSPEIIVYAAQDQVYAEPILKEFENQTGIRVRAIYDSEAVKTVGLANRLIAEQGRPLCDVFWGNEELRTRQLAARGIFRETNGWAAFGYRSRRMAVRAGTTNLLLPGSWAELTNVTYRQQVAVAYPLFGTTATHFMALRHHWGESNWLNWCRAFVANQPYIVDGNSVAVKFLERGQANIALTDSDDIEASRRQGTALQALPFDSETLLIPNTVGVIRDCPNPVAAQKLFVYLQSSAVIDRLIAAGALEGAWAPDVPAATLQPSWDLILRDLDSTTEVLKQIFQQRAGR
jgi:iron(III) transport system substrate-binding protein